MMPRYSRIKTPLTITPPKDAVVASLNLQDGMISSRCHCGVEVARYDATGHAWCSQHFYGCIRFTVANHHWCNPVEWLANPNAYTIMAAPPQWAKKGHNLPFFAAPGELVFGNVSPAEYTARFSEIMKGRVSTVKGWLREHDGQHMTLLCACHTHSLEEKFCHRFLVAKLLVWLGCEEVAWEVPARQERKAA